MLALDVGELDPALAMGVEHQLFELAAARQAVAAEARPQRAAGVERHLKTGALKSLVDQRIDVAALVGIAWQGDCRLRSLHRAAQSASLAQIAGLDQHHGLRRRQRGEPLHRLGKTFAGPAGIAHPDQPAIREHRHRAGLVDQPARVLLELGGVEPHHRKRVVGAEPGPRGEPCGPLRHQAAIRSIDQEDQLAGIGPGKPGFHFMGLLLRHYVPFEARSFAIPSLPATLSSDPAAA